MEDRDHKKIGPELGLFYIDQVVGKGLPMFLPKGATVKRELENFILEEEIKRGYQHVHTPDLARLDLYKKSGHYPHYQDSMYAPIVIDDEEFMLRPMTCPHHFQMFLHKPRSYKGLPMRIAELAQLYRYEQSGELMGLQRVRTFCLADAHIICASEEQAVEEAQAALDLIEHVAGVLGLQLGSDYRYRLSLGDRGNTDKYYDAPEAWEKGEALLREAMKARGCEFEEAKDEAAFYGPKIDIQMKNVNGKEDTAFTVQYDFCMPDQFDLTYIGEDGAEHRAFVIHRSSIGAIERVMAFLIEKYAGAFPLWLAPEQITVLPVSEKHIEYARAVHNQLSAASLRSVLDDANESLGKKIRSVKQSKLPYFIVVGDKEAESEILPLENRDGVKAELSVEDIVSKLQEEIKSRAL